MERHGASGYPQAALAWLVGERPRRILDLGSGSGSFACQLAEAGHQVSCLEPDATQVRAITYQLGTHTHVAARPEALPFRSHTFQVVTASQSLHRFAPGLALSEMARVLRSGGHLGVAYHTRDDTVPWVRRLIAIMRTADPQAMIGDYGVESTQALVDSPYFVNVQRRDFRNWVPITRTGLISMVERHPATAAIGADVRTHLLNEVGELYDSVARAPEPLLLPFRASCWRAEPDHSQLSLVEDRAEGVQITL